MTLVVRIEIYFCLFLLIPWENIFATSSGRVASVGAKPVIGRFARHREKSLRTIVVPPRVTNP